MSWFQINLLEAEGVTPPSLVLLVALPGLDYLLEPVPADACVFLALFTVVLKSG